MPYDIQFRFQHLAVPAVVGLIAFLSYASQIFLLPYLAPGPLSRGQKWKFNLLVAGIWVTYYRAVTVDPGGPAKQDERNKEEEDDDDVDDAIQYHEGSVVGNGGKVRQRYCRKCDRVKAPRAHHCKVCKRCIPKMDHHCPWTANCVSHFTFPHFMRFLMYAETSMCYLEYFLYLRGAALWADRDLPSISLLLILLLTNTLTLFAVTIITLRTIYDLASNTTTIETWEIERHAQLLRRSRALGGYLDGPDGMRVHIKHQEFPYDIGIWANIKQGMGGTGNVLSWIWPFARTRTDSGISFETNGFEDPGVGWPPPDPDRMPRLSRRIDNPTTNDGFSFPVERGLDVQDRKSRESEIQAFRSRQQNDLRRRGLLTHDIDDHDQARKPVKILRRKPFRDRFDEETYQLKNETELDIYDDDDDNEINGHVSGEEGWTDSGGSRLKDYGVDEEVEFYDQEDDVPLAELIRRKKKISGTVSGNLYT